MVKYVYTFCISQFSVGLVDVYHFLSRDVFYIWLSVFNMSLKIPDTLIVYSDRCHESINLSATEYTNYPNWG